ncbi:MAG TPA: hypothetical protein VFW44_07105 [Bryobacteraceae bacterium]|nr:hypothetical protein [Bryobacteraceae bacterium]
MKNKHRLSRGHATALACLFAILSVVPLHADTCDTIAVASEKVWQIPVHIYSTQTFSSRAIPTRSSESIYVGGAVYVMVRGKWTRSRITIAQLKESQDEGKKDTPKPACRYLREESVNGEPAAVYATHGEGDGYKSDLTLWISKSRNVPLRSESDMDTGVAGSSDGKSHASMRYEYANVQPPAGVR